MQVLDGHSDLLYDVTRRRLAGETRVLERRHLERLQRGGVEGLVLAFWYGTGQGETFWKDIPADGAARLTRMWDCAQAEFAECPWLSVVRTPGEAAQAQAAGKRYAFLAIEGMEALKGPWDLDRLAASGLRMGTLTWNEENRFASGAGQDPQKGLTALGRQMVRRMGELGILLDVSHLNDAGFREALDLIPGPVLASHSNCRRLCDVPRNLTDDQLRAIRDSGGVVGLNAHHAFLHAEAAKQTVEMLARHAAHMAEVMGVEHVACGFDFCEYMGPGNDNAIGLEDCGRIPALFACLERMGMHPEELEGIARGNLLRVLA